MQDADDERRFSEGPRFRQSKPNEQDRGDRAAPIADAAIFVRPEKCCVFKLRYLVRCGDLLVSLGSRRPFQLHIAGKHLADVELVNALRRDVAVKRTDSH